MLHQASCVAIDGRGVLIEGPPGSGKSSLTLALMDRGAALVGDDGVALATRSGRLFACPAPHTLGLLEVRNVGLLTYPAATDIPVSLILSLDADAPRFIDQADQREVLGVLLPLVRLCPDSPVLHLRAEAAFGRYALA